MIKCKHCGRNIRSFTKQVDPWGSPDLVWTVGGGWGSACRDAPAIGAGYGPHEPDMSDPKGVEAWLGAP